jgi:hypothetical protein
MGELRQALSHSDAGCGSRQRDRLGELGAGAALPTSAARGRDRLSAPASVAAPRPARSIGDRSRAYPRRLRPARCEACRVTRCAGACGARRSAARPAAPSSLAQRRRLRQRLPCRSLAALPTSATGHALRRQRDRCRQLRREACPVTRCAGSCGAAAGSATGCAHRRQAHAHSAAGAASARDRLGELGAGAARCGDFRKCPKLRAQTT